MNNIIFKVSVKYSSYILNKIMFYNMNFKVINETNNYIYYEISEENFNELVKLDYRKEIIFIKYKGIKNLKEKICLNIEKIIMTLLIITLIFLSRLLIIKVNIKTSDINLKTQIKYALIDNNIKNLSVKKSFKETKRIKENILKKYQDKIEWIEIKKRGYYYDVLIIKREKDNLIKSSDKCNYVAVKSGTITSIKASRGVLLVSENNYVNKGDILIDGKIIYNDELKSEVCAKGKIMGHVWYKINSKMPLNKTKIKKSKKKKYHIALNILNKKFYLFKINENEIESKKIIGSKFLGITKIKTSKNIKKKIKLTNKEAEEKLIETSNNKLLLKLGKDAKIIEQNILKKYVKNSTIYIELLVTVEEELGMVESYI